MAVACVHGHDVVHRDVKPDNFLCSGPEDTVKLCDFGLAEVVRAGGRGVAGQFGTAPFMSPEMIWGSSYGTPVDVWSLGVILYTLVVGQFPYVPEKPCVKLMKAAVAAGVPEPSFQCVAEGVELSLEVLDLVRGLIHRDPEERPRAAAALDHSWFGPEAEGQRRPKHSLKEALAAAQKVGAFTIKDRSNEASDSRSPDSMDLALQELQSRHQLQDSRFGLGSPSEKEDDEETRIPSGDSVSTAAMSQRVSSLTTSQAITERSPSNGDRISHHNSHPDRSPSVASSSGAPSKARPYGIIIRT
jgi:serine/threonine protein kinase